MADNKGIFVVSYYNDSDNKRGVIIPTAKDLIILPIENESGISRIFSGKIALISAVVLILIIVMLYVFFTSDIPFDVWLGLFKIMLYAFVIAMFVFVIAISKYSRVRREKNRQLKNRIREMRNSFTSIDAIRIAEKAGSFIHYRWNDIHTISLRFDEECIIPLGLALITKDGNAFECEIESELYGVEFGTLEENFEQIQEIIKGIVPDKLVVGKK